jgi:hypothetical protein
MIRSTLKPVIFAASLTVMNAGSSLIIGADV